jgi:hypothetical protein
MRIFYQATSKRKRGLAPVQLTDPVTAFLQRPSFARFRAAFPMLCGQSPQSFSDWLAARGDALPAPESFSEFLKRTGDSISGASTAIPQNNEVEGET